MDKPFHPSAEVYDVVYQHLDYAGSAAIVETLIRERCPGASSLLDMACGTGKHLAEWRHTFDHVEGADIDEALLEVARRRLGDSVALHVADYTGFDLGRRYDAITCMFSAIGYASTPKLLDAAVGAMSRHLEPGGVLIIEPWLMPEMIKPPWLRTLVAEGGDIVVLRSSRHRYEGDAEVGGTSDLEMSYLVTTMEGSELITERHVMGVYPRSRYLDAMTSAGLDTEFLEGGAKLGRGLAIGIHR